jgi:hypothetical protein
VPVCWRNSTSSSVGRPGEQVHLRDGLGQRCPVDEREHGCADLGVADTVIEQHRPDIAKPERCGVEIGSERIRASLALMRALESILVDTASNRSMTSSLADASSVG